MMENTNSNTQGTTGSSTNQDSQENTMENKNNSTNQDDVIVDDKGESQDSEENKKDDEETEDCDEGNSDNDDEDNDDNDGENDDDNEEEYEMQDGKKGDTAYQAATSAYSEGEGASDGSESVLKQPHIPVSYVPHINLRKRISLKTSRKN